MTRPIIYVCPCVRPFITFCLSHTGEGGGTNIFAAFFVGGSGAYDDVDEEMVVSEASKLSAGARIFRGS